MRPRLRPVLADSKEMVTPADCEQVRIVQGSRKEGSRQQERFFPSLPPIFLEDLPPHREGTSTCPTQIDFPGVGSLQKRRSPNPLRLGSPRPVVPSKP
jgi:hypothetical protein